MAGSKVGQKARVLIVPPSYFVQGRVLGGGERYALEYARALAELTPTTLALFDQEPSTEHDGKLEIRTYAGAASSNGILFPLRRAFWKELGGFDVLHSMVFPTPLTDLLILSSRLRNQVMVLTDVGGGAPSLSTYLAKLHPRLELNRRVDGLALLSRHAATLFDGWAQPQTLLYGGVDLASFGEEERTTGKYALFVGRLLPHKGVLELIDSVGVQTPLRIVGRPVDPDYVARLRQAAEGKAIDFFFDVDDAELGRHYAGAAVIVQTSLPYGDLGRSTAELLGLVALEGMAHGKPVIVTRTASLPELVLDGVTGYVVEPYDQDALRDRIESVLRSDDRGAKMGDAARKHVEENFTWQKVVERGMKFYGDLAKS